MYRFYVKRLILRDENADLMTAIQEKLRLAAKTIVLPSKFPSPDLKYQKPRAAHRHAQWAGRRSQVVLE